MFLFGLFKCFDFGILLTLRYGKQWGCLGPVAWMAPETLDQKEYSKASDSFSFGVFLWELVARADPYEDRNTIEVACPAIHKGLRLDIPSNAPSDLADLMKRCFATNPSSRPSFDEMVKVLKNYYDKAN